MTFDISQPNVSSLADEDCERSIAAPSLVPDTPEDAADEVVSRYTATCEALLEVARFIYVCCDKFQSLDDLARFSKRLEKRGFLSARDGTAPLRATSKLSMLKKVGIYAETFGQPRILAFLSPEYSKLYQLATLFELIECDVERFISELERLDPDFTRDDVIARIAAIKAEAGREDTAVEQQPVVDLDPSPPAGAPATLDIVVGSASTRDFRALRRYMTDPAESDRLLPRPVLSDDAALVLLAKLSELGVIETRLLPHLGFSRASHLFTVGEANAIDLIDTKVLVVATRGKTTCAVPEAAISTLADVGDVATALFGDAQKKFQLFDGAKTRPGWDAINWTEDRDE